MNETSRVESPRKRGRPLTYEEKWMVYHVFTMLAQKHANGSLEQIDDPYQVTSQYTGVGRSTVANIVKAVREDGMVPQTRTPGNRMQSCAIAGPAEGRVREFIFLRHRQGMMCSTPQIDALLREEFGVTLHERTIQRHLQRMGFSWGRTPSHGRSLQEDAVIRQQRHDYLHLVRENRQRPPTERYTEVYLDESFLHHHHRRHFSWVSEGEVVNQVTGKGRRWCFIHALQQTGLVEGAFLIFAANHGQGDYHRQFDATRFVHWYTEQLLPVLPPRCFIILDRCPFHTMARDALSPAQMRKAELQAWLTERNIAWETHWLCTRLREEVDTHRDKEPIIQGIAQEHGHQVLFLPVHHPELNPIEFVWAAVKDQCAQEYSNTTSFQDQRIHLEQAFTTLITPEYCAKVYAHVRALEETYWETDLLLDEEDEISEPPKKR